LFLAWLNAPFGVWIFWWCNIKTTAWAVEIIGVSFMDYINYIKSNIDDCFVSTGGVSQDIIQLAEKSLEVSFTSEYAKFLSQCGNVNIADQTISGLFSDCDNEVVTGSVIVDTKNCRKNFQLPPNYIVVHRFVDSDDEVLVQKLDGIINDSPLYYAHLQHDKPPKFEQQYISFEEFFKELVDENTFED
jgi:hypothetical protein